jgi:hypothetical protein
VEGCADRFADDTGGAIPATLGASRSRTHHALVRDPNGVLWEFAHNPLWRIGADGGVELRPPD